MLARQSPCEEGAISLGANDGCIRMLVARFCILVHTPMLPCQCACIEDACEGII